MKAEHLIRNCTCFNARRAARALGQLYEVDMRLRPSGESGMLVTTASGFESYQAESAWTWEHQALVRARFVAGDPADTRYVGRWLWKSLADTAFPQKAYGPVIQNKPEAQSTVIAVDGTGVRGTRPRVVSALG